MSLAAKLAQEEPAAVVSTYPFYGYVLDAIAKRGGPKDFLRVTVVTDFISASIRSGTGAGAIFSACPTRKPPR